MRKKKTNGETGGYRICAARPGKSINRYHQPSQFLAAVTAGLEGCIPGVWPETSTAIENDAIDGGSLFASQPGKNFPQWSA